MNKINILGIVKGYLKQKSSLKIKLVLFIFLNFILIIAVSIRSDSIYGTSDDWILDSLLSGQYTEKPEFDLVFITKTFSTLVSLLYSSSELPWYALLLFFSSFGSFVAIYYILIFFKINKLYEVIILLVLPYLNIWFFLKPNYTSSAMIASLAGYLLFYLYLKNKSINIIILASFFIVLGYCIRPQAFYGITLLYSPFIFYYLIKNKKISILYFLLIFLTYFGNSIYEGLSDTAIREYRTWASKLQSLASRPTIYNLPFKLNETAWTPSEYNLVVDLAYIDKKIYNKNWIDSAINQVKFPNNFYKINSNNLKTIFFKWLQSMSGVGLVIFILSCSIVLLTTKNKTFFIITPYLFYYLLIQFLTALFLQSVERVSAPYALGFFLALILITRKNRIQSLNIILSFLVLLIFLNLYLLNNFKVQQNKIIKNRELKTEIENYIQKYDKNIIFISGNQEFYKFNDPFNPERKLESNNVFMIGNWDSFSPFWSKRAKKLGLNPEKLAFELLNNPKVLWAGPEVPNTTLNMQNYLIENGYLISDIKQIDKLPNGNILWNFS